MTTEPEATEAPNTMPTTDEEWRQRLSSEQYEVLRQAGTEQAFTGEFVDTDDDGMYKCGGCGAAVFDSQTKYHSGCGWPSFTDAVPPDSVTLIEDRTLGIKLVEMRSARGHPPRGDDARPRREVTAGKRALHPRRQTALRRSRVVSKYGQFHVESLVAGQRTDPSDRSAVHYTQTQNGTRVSR